MKAKLKGYELDTAIKVYPAHAWPRRPADHDYEPVPPEERCDDCGHHISYHSAADDATARLGGYVCSHVDCHCVLSFDPPDTAEKALEAYGRFR